MTTKFKLAAIALACTSAFNAMLRVLHFGLLLVILTLTAVQQLQVRKQESIFVNFMPQ